VHGAALSSPTTCVNHCAPLNLPPACLAAQVRTHLVMFAMLCPPRGGPSTTIPGSLTGFAPPTTSRPLSIRAPSPARPTPQIFVVKNFGRREAIVAADKPGKSCGPNPCHVVGGGRRLSLALFNVLHHLIALRPGIACQRRNAATPDSRDQSTTPLPGRFSFADMSPRAAAPSTTFTEHMIFGVGIGEHLGCL